MRVLVVGGGGNVGAPTAAALRALGVDVALGRRAPSNPGDVRLDLTRPETFGGALRGCDGLFLLRPPEISDVERTLFPLIDAASASGVARVVFLSVLGAAKSRVIPHRRVELHLAKRGLPSTLLRAGFFMQNLLSAYLDDIHSRRALRLPVGQGRVAFVDARDVGEVAGRAFVDDALLGRALDLTGSEALTFGDVARLMTEVIGTPIVFEDVSAVRYFLDVARRRPWMQALVQTMIHLQVGRGGAAVVRPELGQILGRSPRGMRGFLVDYADVLRGSGAGPP